MMLPKPFRQILRESLKIKRVAWPLRDGADDTETGPSGRPVLKVGPQLPGTHGPRKR